MKDAHAKYKGVHNISIADAQYQKKGRTNIDQEAYMDMEAHICKIKGILRLDYTKQLQV